MGWSQKLQPPSGVPNPGRKPLDEIVDWEKW
jgi:hypothetical protein